MREFMSNGGAPATNAGRPSRIATDTTRRDGDGVPTSSRHAEAVADDDVNRPIVSLSKKGGDKGKRLFRFAGKRSGHVLGNIGRFNVEMLGGDHVYRLSTGVGIS